MDIVIGLTDRPESRTALGHAINEAKLRDGRLHVVRTLGRGLSENPTKAYEWAEQVKRLDAEGAELTARVAAQGIEVSYLVEPVRSDPVAALLKVASRVEADLIVIGLRRRSAVGKLVLGSVSQDVLLNADCAVLAVKSPDDTHAGVEHFV